MAGWQDYLAPAPLFPGAPAGHGPVYIPGQLTPVPTPSPRELGQAYGGAKVGAGRAVGSVTDVIGGVADAASRAASEFSAGAAQAQGLPTPDMPPGSGTPPPRPAVTPRVEVPPPPRPESTSRPWAEEVGATQGWARMLDGPGLRGREWAASVRPEGRAMPQVPPRPAGAITAMDLQRRAQTRELLDAVHGRPEDRQRLSYADQLTRDYLERARAQLAQRDLEDLESPEGAPYGASRGEMRQLELQGRLAGAQGRAGFGGDVDSVIDMQAALELRDLMQKPDWAKLTPEQQDAMRRRVLEAANEQKMRFRQGALFRDRFAIPGEAEQPAQ